MKCRVPSKTELIQKHIDRERQRDCIRTQYFMFLAFNRALGIGARRFARVLNEYQHVLEWYEDARRDGVEEIKLLNAVRSIGLTVESLYPDDE